MTSSPSSRVAAVVVTRDRCELLRQSLTAIVEQTRPPDRLVVIDNASSDGTPDMLREDFPQASVVSLTENHGGAGGFHEGIRAGYADGAAWLWLMDDDSIPRATALSELLAAIERVPAGRPPALLCSRVEWRDGEPHPMNIPTIRRRDHRDLVAASREGLLPLRAATFVSLLLGREAIDREGLPLSHFFWQADDIEYTARILRRGSGYYVPGSVVEHRTPDKGPLPGDDRRFYFSLRNSLFMLRGNAWEAREKPALAWAVLRATREYLAAKGWSTAGPRTILRALAHGLSSPRD